MKAEEMKQKISMLQANTETFTWSELHDPANAAAKAFQQTDRGEGFEFFNKDSFKLVPRELVPFRPIKFDGGVSLSIAIERGGYIVWMPVAILRRTCGLVDERALLSENNEIGNVMRQSMTDVARIDLLYELVGNKTINVEVIPGVHQNRYERGKSPIYDSPLMEEKDRKPLRAYRFFL